MNTHVTQHGAFECDRRSQWEWRASLHQPRSTVERINGFITMLILLVVLLTMLAIAATIGNSIFQRSRQASHIKVRAQSTLALIALRRHLHA